VATPAPALLAYRDLRRTRRRRRLGDGQSVSDALYRAYLTVLFGTIAVVVVAGRLRSTPASAAQTADAARYGPAVVGLLVALVLAVGARSGVRGGPLAFDAADVRHVLMAPVSRGRVLLPMATRKLASWVVLGALVGGGSGFLASLRLPGGRVPWILCGALFGICLGASTAGLAMLASGRRFPMAPVTAVSAVLVVWCVVGVATGSRITPFGIVADLALVPLTHHPWSFAVVVPAAALVVAGLLALPGLSIERAGHRADLGGRIRFGLATRDIRAVIVVSRALAQERPRQRTRWRLAPGTGQRLAVVKRDAQGVLRWPNARILRVAGLGLLAGLAARGVWSGLVVLALPGGLVLWLAGVDAAEGLADEAEHGARSKGYPVPEGTLVLRHVVVPVVVLVAAGLVGMFGAGLVGWNVRIAAVGAVVLLPAAAAGLAAGMVTDLRGAPNPFGLAGVFGPPEIGGMVALVREGLPPAMAVCAFVPVWRAGAALGHTPGPLSVAVQWAWVPLVPCLCALAWAVKRGLR
jgi:hypothetical protein